MKFIPAIDLKDGKCVRLKKGKEDQVTVFNENPLDQAKYFESKGCKRIHVVDLDGAFGRPNINKEIIINIRKNINIEIELGGGIAGKEDFSFWIDQGINYIVLGSLAVKNNDLVLELSNSFPDKIYIALDVLKNEIMIKGWVKNSNKTVIDILNIYNNSLVRGFILTDISRDGMLEGMDLRLINKIISKIKKKIIVGGGLSNYDDLHNLKKINNFNLEGVIAGKSFYSGKIDINKALKICSLNA